MTRITGKNGIMYLGGGPGALLGQPVAYISDWSIDFNVLPAALTGVTLAERDGWTLRAGTAPYGHFGDTRPLYVLENLMVTAGQASQIMRHRPRDLPWRLGYGNGPLRPMKVTLTTEETVRVWRGTDPLAMLAPPLRARALTLEEMMGE
jgi:hypothetical protein